MDLKFGWKKRKLRIWYPRVFIAAMVVVLVTVCLLRLGLKTNITYFYINKSGKKILDGGGYYGDSFHDGLALVCEEYHVAASERTFKYIDRSGNIAIRLSAITAYPFSEGLAAVKIKAPGIAGELVGYIDKTGNWVIDPQFPWGTSFSDGLALIRTQYGHCQYIDRSGKIVIDCKKFHPARFCPDRSNYLLLPFSEGLAASKVNSVWGYIDKKANWVIHPKWTRADAFSDRSSIDIFSAFCEGMARVPEPNCYIGRNGHCRIDGQAFGYRGDFSEGHAAVSINGLWGFIDSNGNIVIKPKFENASVFSEGLAAVTYKGKVGYINHNGNFVIQPQFAYGGDFSDGVAVVIPFAEPQKGFLLKPDLLLWGKPTGKYFARYPIEWIYSPPPYD